MATIKDVAARARVSLSTVSHVLNKTRIVLPETAARVEAAIRDLGYQPNSVARSLKSNRTMTIGMLVANTRNPFFAEVVRGVEDQCFAHGYSLILCNTEDEESRKAAYLNILYQKRVDGLVVMTTNPHGRKFDLDGLFADVPIVSLFTSTNGVDLLVIDDSYRGGMLAANRLIDGGARHLACVSGELEHRLASERLRGFQDGAAAAGFPLDAGRIVSGGWTLAGGAEAIHTLVSRGKTVDGIFAMNDMMAIGALAGLRDVGLSVPGDVSVVGYDNIEFGAYASPPLTTISQDGSQAGRVAVDGLLRLIAGEVLPSCEIQVELRLVERASVRSR